MFTDFIDGAPSRTDAERGIEPYFSKPTARSRRHRRRAERARRHLMAA